MSLSVVCPHCAKSLSLADKFAGVTVRCPGCKQKIQIPAAQEAGDEWTPIAGDGAITTKPKDGQSEWAPADETYGVAPRCPSCNNDLSRDAVICTNCGFNRKTGKKLKTKVKLGTRTHNLGYAWSGSYTRFTYEKMPKGRGVLTVDTFIFFIKIGTRVYEREDIKAAWISYSQGFGPVGWAIMIGLMCLGFCPGIFFWWYAFNKDTFALDLVLQSDQTIRLYKGGSDQQMRDLSDFLQKEVGLPLERK